MSLSVREYQGYRDSGLRWIEEIPKHWVTERAKWLFRKMDRPVDPDDSVVTCFRDGVVTLRKNRRVRGFTESLKEIGYQGVREGDLVIHAMDAFAGAVGVSDSDGKCTPVYAVCQPKRDVNPHYYAHLVRQMARTQWLAALARGIRERSSDFRFDGFAAQVVPVPSRWEQDHIVLFLAHADHRMNHLIRTKLRLIELLNEQKQAIVYRAVTRGLDPNAPLKPSGIDWLPEIPRQWSSTMLGALASSFQTGPFGTQLHAHDYVPNGIPVVNPSHMKNGRVAPDPSCALGATKADELAQHRLRRGDIVFARRGVLGRCAIVGETEEGMFCGTGSLRMRPNGQAGEIEYLLQLLLSRGVALWFSQQSVGSTMDNLNTGIVARLPLPLPPLEEQRAILAHLTAQTTTIDIALTSACRQINLLREYRTRLISDVVTGKLDVRGMALPDGEDFELLEEIAEEGAVVDDTEDRQEVADVNDE